MGTDAPFDIMEGWFGIVIVLSASDQKGVKRYTVAERGPTDCHY